MLVALAACSGDATGPRPATWWERSDLKDPGALSGTSVVAFWKGQYGNYDILDPRTGRTLWEQPGAFGTLGRTIVGDLFIEMEDVSGDTTIRTTARDAATGRVRWTRTAFPADFRVPVARIDSLLVEVSYQTSIGIANAATGAEVRRLEITSGPCAVRFGCGRSDDETTFTDGASVFMLLSASAGGPPALLVIPPTGDARSVLVPGPYAAEFGRPVFAGASRSNGTVVLVSNSHALGLDASTGALRWTVEFAPFALPFVGYQVFHAQLVEGGGESLLFVRGNTYKSGPPVQETRKDVAYRVIDGAVAWERSIPKPEGETFQYSGDCGANRVVGLSSDGTLDLLDIRTRRFSSRRYPELAPLLTTSPDDFSEFGKPFVRTHPSGVVLVMPYERTGLSGFSCEP